MILVLGGTRDGRELAAALAALGWPVTLSVVSGYGRELAEDGGTAVIAGALDARDMAAAIAGRGVRIVVDATHPYAAAASENAMAACRAAGVRYLRYERPAEPVPAGPEVHAAADAPAAARLAARLGRVVFLTVGSRTLPVFRAEPSLAGCRLVARILPQPEVLAECLALGFSPGDIVAMQGPFSHEMNVALFRAYGAQVIVTKNSGEVGGTGAKLSAARELDIPVVLIDRPRPAYTAIAGSFQEVFSQVKEVYA